MTITRNTSALCKMKSPDAVHLPATRTIGSVSPHSRPQFEIASLLSLLQTMATQRPHLLGHGDRTASYALLLGTAVGLSAADLIHLHYAALLHDIGQLTLPDELLKKDGPLTAEEYERVQSHSRAGAELLESISFLQIPALWIAHHHEHWDGTGYPYGLPRLFIPLGSRILAVADTFDALTSNRPDGRLHNLESALRLLRMVSGSQLDPTLVQAFVRLEPELVKVHLTRGGLCLPPQGGAPSFLREVPRPPMRQMKTTDAMVNHEWP